MCAQVAVWDATIYYDKLYTYKVPFPMEGHIFVGSIVLAPFGRGSSRPRIGVVLGLENIDKPDGRVKELYDVAPEDAKLTEELLLVVKYLKQATFCTWYEAVKTVLPYGAQYKAEQIQDGEGIMWRLKPQMRRHTETVYIPVKTPPENPAKKITPKQQSVLDCLNGEPLSKEEISASCGAGKSVIDTLVKNGYLETGQRDKSSFLEDDYAESPALSESNLESPGLESQPSLSEAQQDITDRLTRRMQSGKPKPALLHGVTGSGKTAVFLELVSRVLSGGKTALVLVPEIGLTPQMQSQLKQRFGSLVAVQHSAMSNTDRLLQWRLVRRGEAKVVVGTRSAVFAPLENIGLIVVDEEQERTYQSESSPRYDAIEVARRRATHHGALLLLASATPAVSDYYLAQTGRYELFELKERYGSLPLPAVELIDMKAELMAGHSGIISSKLAEGIQQTIKQGNQVILLLNRRGYHRVGVCRECGEAVKCTECSVPMVFHKTGRNNRQTNGEAPEEQAGINGRLVCHYCGKTMEPAPHLCPECGGELRYAGFGTQRMEEELEQKFPDARVLRMDLDSTSKRGSHSKMLKKFANGEYDILMGTQMVAKGLDFERVSLVGVVGIDSLLFSQGYRAFENVFSLVTQVVGRSGRSLAPGSAMIQTMDVENTVLNLAAKQDYQAFYNQEIAFRKMALYPPFCNICVVQFTSKQEADALRGAQHFSRVLAVKAANYKGLPLRLLGPAPMGVAMIAGIYRYRLTLKCRLDAQLRSLLAEVLEQYNKDGWPKKTSASLDFNSSAE